MSSFKMRVRTRHNTHKVLRNRLPSLPFRTVVRLGSTTPLNTIFGTRSDIVEINTVESVKNSSNKRIMKELFSLAGVKSARWFLIKSESEVEEFISNSQLKPISLKDLPFPIVVKHIFGSRGSGNYLIKDASSLKEFLKGRDLKNYIIEKYYNYNREYRLHITNEGCFYTCRKMLKKDTLDKDRWYKNDSNSCWIIEENEMFNKPLNWKDIVSECVKALNAIGLDFGAFDIRVQSSHDEKKQERKNPEFIVIESNSAPSFGNITLEKYIEILPQLATRKAKEREVIK